MKIRLCSKKYSAEYCREYLELQIFKEGCTVVADANFKFDGEIENKILDFTKNI